MWNVPDGSDIRARHIGASSVATFSTSVRTPTTKSRFTFAPRGVTTYDGLRSPPPETSFVESLYSRANTRHAISRIIAAPLACHNRWTNPCAFLHSSVSLPRAPAPSHRSFRSGRVRRHTSRSSSTVTTSIVERTRSFHARISDSCFRVTTSTRENSPPTHPAPGSRGRGAGRGPPPCSGPGGGPCPSGGPGGPPQPLEHRGGVLPRR